MSGTARKFELISDDDVPRAPVADPGIAAGQQAAARAALVAALTALSQRSMTAITNLFSLVLVGSVWVLAARVLEDPTPNRLAGAGGYAVFCLLIDIVRRKRK